jgi:transposase
MGMGRRAEERQQDLWIASDELPKTAPHAFYQRLNRLLAEAQFDRFVEALCQSHYAAGTGRDSIPPGVYFRMLLVGYFEGLDSQRGIAWRCADSLSLRAFLGVPLNEATPDHSSLSKIRDRLPLAIHEQVFAFVLRLADEQRLISGKTVGVDSTTLEANAAMKSIVRQDSGEDWREYITRLMREKGVVAEQEQPSDEELRRFDKQRKDKKVSNDEWVSASDPESRITQLKDGRTHLAYKAEHVVDLQTNLVLAATLHSATNSDAETLVDSVLEAQANLQAAGSEVEIEEVAADKGYHKTSTLELATALNLRTYIPEPKRPHKLRWTDKPPAYRAAVIANRQRMRRKKGKRLQRLRSERVERTFAHVCETGGARRNWLRGLAKLTKRYLVQVAAHNLAVVMRKLFGIGKPRVLQGLAALLCLAQTLRDSLLWPWCALPNVAAPFTGQPTPRFNYDELSLFRAFSNRFSTGC